MAPNISSTDKKILTEENNVQKGEFSVFMKTIGNKSSTQNKNEMYIKTEGWSKTELKWNNIVIITFFHLYFVYACFAFKFFENLRTIPWACAVFFVSGLGITCGAHRLWTYRVYKAKWPLRIILVIFYASAGMNNLYECMRDHRVHHRYTNTDADPHNSNRGFFFSYVGWLMMKKHPEVIRKGREIDMRDFLTDPIVVFSCKYFWILKFVFAFLLPVMVPVYGWNETWFRSFASQMIRYVIVLNTTWRVNSVAHVWGSRPYNAHINPTENRWVDFLRSGEGYQNYHHVFPWDYKASELRCYMFGSTGFIDLFAKFRWAYDLRQPSPELVRTITMNNGDGSHHLWGFVPYSASKRE